MTERTNELSALFNVAQSITGALNVEEVLRQVVREAAHLMNTKICSLMLLNDDRTELAIQAVYGGGPQYIQRPNLRVDESLIGQVVRTGRPLTVLDVRRETRYRSINLALQEGLCSLLSVPLTVRGKTIGVLNTYKSTQHHFTDDETQLLSSLADLAAIAIDNARLYESLIALEERIRRMDKLGVLGELAVGVAHEIRNPLTIIKMLFHGLQVSNAEDREDITIIRDEIERMNGMVTRFLDYARPSQPVQEDVDINHILGDTLRLVEHRIRGQQVQVQRSLAPLPPLQADPEKIQQVFLNLFLNALDAMPTGGTLQILTWPKESTWIQIQIRDSGSGIPPDIRDSLFLPFVSRKEGGLGLGLSIVQRIIEEHRGTIRVESEKRLGSTFIIDLPANR